MVSTKSERKPLKRTIWLTDQITQKFQNRSLQNFQTWQFTSLSLRKQQRNGLNGTVKSFNCFLTCEEKYSFVVFRWLAKFRVKKVFCVVLRMKCWKNKKMTASLLEVRRRLPVAFFFLFTGNVEFLQTFAFKFVCHKYTSILGQMFLVRKRWVHETVSFTRIKENCKQSIEHKTQLQ